MANYLINFTDPLKAPILIAPYTSNGLVNPSGPVPPPFYGSSVSADTSLILLGQGFTSYGEVVQENLVHLLENFASQYEPAVRVEGQLWYNNVTQRLLVCTAPTGGPAVTDRWTSIMLATGTGDLDLSGNKIINLGDATDPTDAVNLQTADARYVNITGDTMTGNLVIQPGNLTIQSGDLILTTGNIDLLAGDLTVSAGGTVVILSGADLTIVDAPVNGVDATNKAYVDGKIATDIAALGAVYVNVSGDTMTGNLTISNADLLMTGAGSTIDMGGNNIINVADPVNPQDAATRAWVLSVAGGGGGADGVVTSGSYSSLTNQLTLNRSMALPSIVIPGIGAAVHTHTSTEVTHLVTLSGIDSEIITDVISDPSYPDVPLSTVLQALDRSLFNTHRRRLRVTQQGDGVTTIFGTPQYITDSNTLMVYVNGVKYYANQRASMNIDIQDATFLPIYLGTDTLLAAGPYTFTIVVDGISYAGITVTSTGPGFLISDVLADIEASLITNLVPAHVIFDDNLFTFTSDTTGHTSQVWITSDLLFSAIATAISGTVAFGPGEDNIAGITVADTVLDTFSIAGDFTAAFITGARFVVSGSTGNDGFYTVAAPGATFLAGTTTIPVTTAVPSGVANGDIFFCRTLAYAEPDPAFVEADSIEFTTAPADGSIIEITVT